MQWKILRIRAYFSMSADRWAQIFIWKAMSSGTACKFCQTCIFFTSLWTLWKLWTGFGLGLWDWLKFPGIRLCVFHVNVGMSLLWFALASPKPKQNTGQCSSNITNPQRNLTSSKSTFCEWLSEWLRKRKLYKIGHIARDFSTALSEMYKIEFGMEC